MRSILAKRGLYVGSWKAMVVLVGLVFTSVVGARAEPLAADLLGTWTCVPADGGAAFRWTVTDELPGDWLVGRGFEDGQLTSLEAWAYDNRGRLMERRQFSPRGRFIELTVSDRTEDSLSSSGTALERDGTTFEVGHSLTILDQKRFEAVWQVRRGEQWSVVANEICNRVDP